MGALKVLRLRPGIPATNFPWERPCSLFVLESESSLSRFAVNGIAVTLPAGQMTLPESHFEFIDLPLRQLGQQPAFSIFRGVRDSL
jgi:hypothetical protein